MKEYGSFFSTVEKDLAIETNKWINNFDYKIHYTGRQALLFILDNINLTNNIENIYLPKFYCKDVYVFIKKFNDKFMFYEDKNLSDIEFNKNDVLLLNSLFGIYSNDLLNNQGDKPITIEDHTHSWSSENCINSTANYCFASLRKTYPIPLGAVTWSKNKTFNELKGQDNSATLEYVEIWNLIKNAQDLKREYLLGVKVDKDQYLKKISYAEKELNQEVLTSADVLEEHKDIILKWMTCNLLKAKKKNTNSLLKLISLKNQDFVVLNTKETTGFGLILEFINEEKMNRFKTYIIKNNIFPANLWPENEHMKKKHLLIHTDFRYNAEDMNYIAKRLNEYV